VDLRLVPSVIEPLVFGSPIGSVRQQQSALCLAMDGFYAAGAYFFAVFTTT